MPEDAQRIWKTALGQLQLQVTRPNYDTWLKDTVGLMCDNGHFVVGVPSDFVSESLATKMCPLIAKTISKIVGRPLEVTFELMLPTDGHRPPLPLFQATHAPKLEPAANATLKPRLNHKFTFERFIVGDCNRLAAAASLATADLPGQVYNPLFLYGPGGLGKSHLLHAIGHRASGRGLRLIYASAEHFTTDFVAAVTQGRREEFRQKYRTAHILLIDDIQFLAGKEATQEEFFYTFNDLHAAGSQIVITGHCPPRALIAFEPRLQSRLQWGLTADLQLPDPQTRLAILRAKARDHGIDLPADVASFLASHLQDNLCDLEGCLNNLVALARLLRSPITPNLASQALSTLNPSPGQPHPLPNHILQAVASYFNLSPQALTGKSRAKPLADARHIAMFLLREDANQALKAIGHLLGQRDHSTVIHGYQKVARSLNNDPHMQRQLTDIRSLLPTA